MKTKMLAAKRINMAPTSLVIASHIRWRRPRPALLVSRKRVKICLPAEWQKWRADCPCHRLLPKSLVFGQRIDLRRDIADAHAEESSRSRGSAKFLYTSVAGTFDGNRSCEYHRTDRRSRR